MRKSQYGTERLLKRMWYVASRQATEKSVEMNDIDLWKWVQQVIGEFERNSGEEF